LLHARTISRRNQIHPQVIAAAGFYDRKKSGFGCQNLNYSMIVTVVSMGMVQVTIDQVIDMIAVGHGFMATIGTMDMTLGVPADVMVAGAFIGMRSINFNDMLLNLAALLMHQMAIFEIICVAVMFNRCVPATGAVLMTSWFTIHKRNGFQFRPCDSNACPFEDSTQ
jgi:hypothetical protein